MPVSLKTPITLPTGYGSAILGPYQNLQKIVFTVTGGVVVYQLAKLDQTGKPQFDQAEAQYPPGTWAFDKCYGINLRSRDAGSLATIDPITGFFDDDANPYNPGNIPGTSSVVTGAVNVQHNEALVASQPTIDFDDSPSATFVWTITNDGANTRVKVQPPDVVSSFNTRTGAVVPASGDYLASQVTNAADKASIANQLFSGNISTGPTGTGLFTGSQTTGCFVGGNGLSTFRSFNSTFSDAFAAGFTTDTTSRISINNAGLFQWSVGTSAVDMQMNRVGAAGAGTFVQAMGVGIGYGTGTGGSSGGLALGAAATINKATGTLVYTSGTLVTGAFSSTTLTNSTVAATDVVTVTVSLSGTVGSPVSATARITAAGTVVITLVNNSGATINAATTNVTIAFAILKTATS